MSFVPIPGRDAYATFAGYLYQVNVTVLRWLNLAPHNTLELEAGEDIDMVRAESDGTQPDPERVMEQLKHVTGSLTLRSGDALESICNFCEHPEAESRGEASVPVPYDSHRWPGANAVEQPAPRYQDVGGCQERPPHSIGTDSGA